MTESTHYQTLFTASSNAILPGTNPYLLESIGSMRLMAESSQILGLSQNLLEQKSIHSDLLLAL